MIDKADFPLLPDSRYSDELCECGSGLRKTHEDRRLNTAYVDDHMNWSEPCCDECFAEQYNYWQERWEDYWDGLL